jgi:hypothetical protein
MDIFFWEKVPNLIFEYKLPNTNRMWLSIDKLKNWWVREDWKYFKFLENLENYNKLEKSGDFEFFKEMEPGTEKEIMEFLELLRQAGVVKEIRTDKRAVLVDADELREFYTRKFQMWFAFHGIPKLSKRNDDAPEIKNADPVTKSFYVEYVFLPPKRVYKYKPRYKLHHFTENLTGWKPYQAFTLQSMEEYEQKIKEILEAYERRRKIEEEWEKELEKKEAELLPKLTPEDLVKYYAREVYVDDDVTSALMSLAYDKMFFVYYRALMPFLWAIFYHNLPGERVWSMNASEEFLSGLKAVAFELKKLHEYWGDLIDDSILPYDEVSKMKPEDLKIDDLVRFLEVMRKFTFEMHAQFLATLVEKARNNSYLANEIVEAFFLPARDKYTVYYRGLKPHKLHKDGIREYAAYGYGKIFLDPGPIEYILCNFVVKMRYFDVILFAFLRAGEYMLTRVRELRPPNCYIEDFYHDYLLAKMRNDDAYARKVVELFRQYLMNAQNLVNEYIDVEGEIKKLVNLSVEKDHDLIPINLWYWIIEVQKFSTGYEVHENDAWFIGNHIIYPIALDYSLPEINEALSVEEAPKVSSNSKRYGLFLKFRSMYPAYYSSDALSWALGIYAHSFLDVVPQLAIDGTGKYYDNPYPNPLAEWVRWNIILYSALQGISDWSDKCGYFMPKPGMSKSYYEEVRNAVYSKEGAKSLPFIFPPPISHYDVFCGLSEDELKSLKIKDDKKYRELIGMCQDTALEALNSMLRKLDGYEINFDFLDDFITATHEHIPPQEWKKLTKHL